MDFKQLKAFLTIADTGNVTRAAEILNLVQPAVSRQVRLLEEDLGQVLFDRERYGMVLTEAGQSLVAYARRAMLELDRARAEITGNQGGVRGLVTVGLLPSTADVLSSALVSALAASHPGIRVRIASAYAGTLRQWLNSGEVDVALLYGAERAADMHATALIDEPLWIIGLPDEKLRAHRPVQLARLSDRPMVLPSAPHGIRTLVEHACAVSKTTLNVSVETNSLSVQRSLVLGGHGLTILPPLAVAEDLLAGRLSGAPIGSPPISRTIVLALSNARPAGVSIRATVDALTHCARDAVTSKRWIEARWLAS